MAHVGFAVQADRDAVLAAVARVIARRGYERSTLAEIAIESGWSRRRIRREFGDVEGCFYALFAWTFHRTLAYVLDRTDGVPWPARVRDGLEAFLELLGSEPIYVHANVDAVQTLGADGSLRLETAVEAFTAFLTPGFERTGTDRVPALTSQLIGMSVVHVITKHVAEDRVEDLPQALPQLVAVALMPFCAVEDIDALLATR
jgi:AcrR family transcriptional regulator